MNRIFRRTAGLLMAAAMIPAASALASAEITVPADTQPWPGMDEITAVTDLQFMSNSSGLDYYEGRLYAVDNSPGTLYVMDVAGDGTLTFVPGYEEGKALAFSDDADDPNAGGPDSEGVTVDGEGYVYIASERDSDNDKVNDNVILKIDPEADGDRLVSLQEWNLTADLPDARANKGIEAVEWVSADDIAGVLTDNNTGEPFDPADYPDMVCDGIFFVGLETNGHVYAFVLNADSSVVLLADIDPGLGGVMALDYDTETGLLWAVADSAVNNLAAVIDPGTLDMTYYDPAGMDTATHNEGFAIGDIAHSAQDGLRPVYHFCDGAAENALSVTYLDPDYAA